MARVLITGANGFVGSHLAPALVERGDEVTCLVRTRSNTQRLDSLSVKMAYGDLTDAESLRGPIAGQEVVYHVGACIRTLRNAEFYRTNEGGTANVAQVCAERGNPPVLIVVSSRAAVAPTKDATAIREDYSAPPVSHYGRSKRGAERVARRYADRVPVTVVRASGVFGEADRGCLEIFKPIQQLGIHLSPAGLGVSMIHCADLVELLMLAARRGKRLNPAASDEANGATGFYYAASDEYPMYDQFGRMIGEALGRRRALTVPLPSVGVWTLAAVSELAGQIVRRPAVLSIEKWREATAGCWFCSPQTAIDELGFSLGASLTDRLRQTAQWYHREGWL